MFQSVEGICSRYRGHELIKRLEFLAGKAPEHALVALNSAAAAAKTTTDTATYQRIAGLGGSIDSMWVATVDQSSHIKQSQLDKELALLSSNQMRDSIRVESPV
jgi:hypothetical protein